MNLFELGQALKDARIRQRLTQGELASRTGVSLSSISGLERGSLPEIGTVKLLQLFAAVELELQPRPVGQRRTLDDVNAENVRTSYAAQTASDTMTIPMARLKATGKSLAGTAQTSEHSKPADRTKEFSQTRQRVRHAKNSGDNK
jgi:transcriptional regulator with XRE-family HTH domain